MINMNSEVLMCNSDPWNVSPCPFSGMGWHKKILARVCYNSLRKTLNNLVMFLGATTVNGLMNERKSKNRAIY